MLEFEQEKPKDALLYEQLLFSSEKAEQILIQLGNSGALLPDRFYRPAGLTEPDGCNVVPEADFPLRKQWAGAIREAQDALNSAASDVSQYESYVKNGSLQQRELTVLQNAASKILQRLTNPSSNDRGKSDFALYQRISERLGPFSDVSDLDAFLAMLGRFLSVVSKMHQEVEVETKEQLGLLFSSDLTNPLQDEDPLTPQNYLIRRYARVFEDVFELVPSAHTSKSYHNHSGVYPDFIEKIMEIHTGKSYTRSTLTKALQRAAEPKPTT